MSRFDRYEQAGLAGLHTAKGPGRPAIVRIDNRKEVDQIERIVEEHPQKLAVALERIEAALRSALAHAGWAVEDVRRCMGRPDDWWLSVRASRA